MWSVLDHLNAMIVAPVVVVLAAGIYFSIQHDRIDATSRSAVVDAFDETIDWIERDLTNLGAGYRADSSSVVAYEWRGATPSVTFVTGADPSVMAAPRTIQYEKAAVGDAFELRRYEVLPGGRVLTAKSPATLLDLTLHMTDVTGRPTEDVRHAQSLSIWLSMAPLFGHGQPVEWGQTFYFPTRS